MKLIKFSFITLCIIIACFSGIKAYSICNPTVQSNLLSENIEALSDGGEGRKFEVRTCFMEEDLNGNTSSYICEDGTTRYNTVYDCPSEGKPVNLFSAQGNCVVEVK